MRRRVTGLDELVQRLQTLGFSQYEARAYCALLQKSPANGHEVAKTAGIPTSKVYETLERLHQKGSVRVQRSEPTLGAPVPYRDLVGSLRQRMESTFSAVEQGLAQLGHEQDTALTWSLSGHGHVVDSMRRAIDRARERLAAIIPASELGELGPPLWDAAERGVVLDVVAGDGATLDLPSSDRVRVRRRPAGAGRRRRGGDGAGRPRTRPARGHVDPPPRRRAAGSRAPARARLSAARSDRSGRRADRRPAPRGRHGDHVRRVARRRDRWVRVSARCDEFRAGADSQPLKRAKRVRFLGGESCGSSSSATSCRWTATTRVWAATSWSCRWTRLSTPTTLNGCARPTRCCWDGAPTKGSRASD